jgi:hypothetical protein
MKHCRMRVSITLGLAAVLAVLAAGIAAGPASAAITFVTLNPTGQLINNDTQVQVSGIVQATRLFTVITQVTVIQSKRGETYGALGAALFGPVFDPPFAWSVVTEPRFGVQFSPGWALVRVQFEDIPPGGGAPTFAEIIARVKLQR